ncbi:MAG: hypothetical protein ABH829_02335 [archaeon]
MVTRYKADKHGHAKEFMLRPFECSCSRGRMHIGMPSGCFEDEPSYDYEISEACYDCPANPYKGVKLHKGEKVLKTEELRVRKVTNYSIYE